jgi:uncharacterized protein YigE (DUF2233 family)
MQMRLAVALALGVLAAALLACSASVVPGGLELTVVPAPTTARPSPPGPLATPLPDDTGWQALEDGLELRRLVVRSATGAADRLLLVRLSPEAQARLAVRYAPDDPRRLSEWWQSERESALLVVNAGYYTADYRATGLLVSDGVAYGTTFKGAGGMLAVQAQRAELRWLAERPVAPGEQFDQAVQGWPMLLGPGGEPLYGEPGGPVARRTAVGVDRSGRLVFVLSPLPFFTLDEFARWLAAADLELELALNLDGGQSTGLWLDPVLASARIDSFARIPAVLVVRR